MTGIGAWSSDGHLAALLLDLSLKATLLLALSLALVQLYERARASLRVRLLLIALAGTIALPVLGPVLPSWSLPVLPDPLGVHSSGNEVESPTPAGHTDRITVAASPRSSPALTRESDSAAPRRDPVVDLRPPAPPALHSRIASTAPLAIALFWGLGAFASLLRQRQAHRRVRALEREARVELDAATLAALEGARRRVGIERPVQLLTSDRVASPMTWGHRYPVVLLPADHHEWSDERRRVVLHHELVHIRRGDWRARVLARAACAVYWFHPLVWMTLTRLVAEQERACDEQVLALGTRASSYAHHLLELARRGEAADAPPIPVPALPMARRPQLEVRLMSILRASERKSPARRAVLALPAILLLSGLVPVLATVEPWMQETIEPQGPPATRQEALVQLRAAAAEIQTLEQKMEPYEVRLEEIEAQMDPTEELLESVEVSLEPYEQRLEAIERELEPLEREREALEARLEPHEAQIAEVEAGLEPLEARLEEIEAGLEPYEAQLAELESRLRPFEARMEEAEASYRAQAEALEAALAEEQESDAADRQELERTLEELHSQLEPFHRQVEAIQSEMEPVLEEMQQIHREMEPVHQQMQAVFQEMEPTFERMRGVQAEMEPVFAEMRALGQEMEPVHDRMREVYQEMEPVMERMRDLQVDMEPVHQRMQEVHREMDSVHQEMQGLHERMQRSSRLFIEATLREELSSLDPPEDAIAAAAEAVQQSVHLNLNDDRLRLRGSVSEVGDLIQHALRANGVEGQGLDTLSERAARAVLELEIEIQ